MAFVRKGVNTVRNTLSSQPLSRLILTSQCIARISTPYPFPHSLVRLTTLLHFLLAHKRSWMSFTEISLKFPSWRWIWSWPKAGWRRLKLDWRRLRKRIGWEWWNLFCSFYLRPLLMRLENSTSSMSWSSSRISSYKFPKWEGYKRREIWEIREHWKKKEKSLSCRWYGSGIESWNGYRQLKEKYFDCCYVFKYISAFLGLYGLCNI